MNFPEVSADAPRPCGPTPSARQLLWHRRAFYGFLHFTVNTFTDKEWGYGDEAPAVFAPPAFDADRIAGAAAEAGMTGLILTCKHHDGFCLWPSRYTEHSVRNSPWRRGRGDAVREMAEACRAQRLGFGVYLSPWDRNHAEYGRTAYVEYFRNQLNELTSEYGELFEVWFDGANGGDGYYGGAREFRGIDRQSYYGWEKTWEIVRRNQPNAAIFGEAGPDVRWVGNERGVAGDPCWHTVPRRLLFPGSDKESFKTRLAADMVEAWDSPAALLNSGARRGDTWMPAECDVSIRPGWFYHAAEDARVRTAEELVDLYFQSVGRGAALLLNLPPDRRGLIHENDIGSIREFRRRLDRIFAHDLAKGGLCTAGSTRGRGPRFAPANVADGNPESYWAPGDAETVPELVVEFSQPVTFNIARLREFLPLGQRVGCFAIDFEERGAWREWCCKSAMGAQRLIRGPRCTTRRARLRIVESSACPAISEFGLFYDSESVEPAAPAATRQRRGE